MSDWLGPGTGERLQVRSITGSKIGLVEDEPLIAMDIAHALERPGELVHGRVQSTGNGSCNTFIEVSQGIIG